MNKDQLDNIARHLSHVIEIELNEATAQNATLNDLRAIVAEIEATAYRALDRRAKLDCITLCSWCNNTANYSITRKMFGDRPDPVCSWHLPAIQLDGDTVTRLDLNNPVPA